MWLPLLEALLRLATVPEREAIQLAWHDLDREIYAVPSYAEHVLTNLAAAKSTLMALIERAARNGLEATAITERARREPFELEALIGHESLIRWHQGTFRSPDSTRLFRRVQVEVLVRDEIGESESSSAATAVASRAEVEPVAPKRGYQESDEKLAAEALKQMADPGAPRLSQWAWAGKMAPRAEGVGSDESKQKRLARAIARVRRNQTLKG